MKRAVAAVAALLVVGAIAFLASQSISPRDDKLPKSMAAIGDSITVAVNTERGSLGAHAELSWATGNADDEIDSHYERIVEDEPQIRGKNLNLATPGTRMAAALDQARKATDSRAEYVTILMGANDVCALRQQEITSPALFGEQFRFALAQLMRDSPKPRVLVLSIPDVYRLWSLFRDDPRARFVWGTFQVCGAMLAEGQSEQERLRVRSANESLNQVLEKVCAGFSTCRFDGGAMFRYRFEKSDVSDADFFHPSKRGQGRISEVAWRAGFWP